MSNDARGTPRRILRWVAVGGLVLTTALLFLFDPVRHGFYPTCWFHKFTGLNCPGCGTLRAMHALLHGHLATAFHDNALFVVSLPFLAYLSWRQFFYRDNVSATRTPYWCYWMGIIVVILFGILRNLPFPAFAWMSP